MNKAVLYLGSGFLFMLGTLAMFGEDKKPAPQFSKDQIIEFFKADAELAQAQLQLEHTQEASVVREKSAAYQKQSIAMSVFCGADHQFAFGQDGFPICQDKPEARLQQQKQAPIAPSTPIVKEPSKSKQ